MRIHLPALSPSLRDHAMTKTVRFTILGSLFILIGLAALTIYLQTNHSAEAAWYNSSWNYREPFTVTNSSGGTLTNIQKAIHVNTSTFVSAGKLQTSCNDLRFTDNNGNPLSYYIDSGCNTSTTTIWIIIPTLINSTSTFYMYYGNPSASQGSTTTGFDNVIGLQGYWTMNEASGSTAFDTSPNVNNATATGTTIISGEIGNARSFTGSDTLTVKSGYLLAGNQVSSTVEAWVKYSGSGGPVYSENSAFGEIYGLTIGTNAGFATFNNGSVWSGATGSTTLSTGVWYFIVGTYSNTGGQKIYVNGQIDGSGSAGGINTNLSAGSVSIGSTQFNSPNTFCNCSIDDVKAYNTTRNATQILADYQNQTRYTISSAASVPSYSFGSEQVGPGPAAYWKFDEGTGTMIDDSTSGNNYGNTTSTWQTGTSCYPEANCVWFDGSSGKYVSLTSVPTTGTGSFSVFSWIKTASSGTRKAIVSYGTNSCTGLGFYLFVNGNNQVETDLSCAGGPVSSVTVTDGKWHDVGVVNTSGSFQIYVDGIASGSPVSLSPNIGSGFAYIGEDTAAEAFLGTIDDMKVYNTALSSSQVQQDYNFQLASPAPVGFWKMNAGSGTTISDSIGSNTGTLNGSIVSGPTWQTADQCISGKCLYFNGSTNYLQTAYKQTSVSQYTVGAWIRTTTTAAIAPIVADRGAGTGHSLTLWMVSGKVGFIDDSNSIQLGLQSTQTYNDGKWHYVVGTFNGSGGVTASQFKLYVDGNAVNTINAAAGSDSAPLTGLGGVQIGYSTAFNDYYQGFIDDVKIYPYVRTASQVKADYTSRGSVNASANVLGTSSQNNIAALNNGLLGYWKADEPSGSTTADASGNGNTGTLTGSPSFVAGKFGRALQYSGANYTSTSVAFPTSGSLAVWAYPTSYSDWIGPAGWKYAPASGGYILIDNGGGGSPGKWRAVFNATGTNEQDVVALNSDVLNAWTHIVMTWNYVGTTWTIKFYVNGAYQGSATETGTVTGNIGPFYMGTTGQAVNNDFVGKTDETRVYNRALSPADVQNLYNYAPGPVAYYNFEEGSGSTVNDRSGYGNNGTWNGTLGNQWVAGKIGKAGNFDGTTNYVNAPYASSLNITGSITLSAWFKTRTTGRADMISRYSSTPFPGYALVMDPSGTVGRIGLWVGDGSNGFLTTTSTFNDGKWHYATGIYDGTTAYIYVDGILQISGARTASMNNTSTALKIGEVPDTLTPNFLGQLDDLRVYNYAISQKQIISDMNGSGASTSLDPAPFGYWKFDEGYGTTAHNIGNGGSTYNLSVSGPTWTQSGKFGKALHAASTADEIINNGPFMRTDPMTISFWWKPDGTLNSGSSPGILAQYDSREIIYFNRNSGGTTSDGKLWLAIYDGTWRNISSVNTTWNANTWYNIVYSWSAGGPMSLYVNGVLQGTFVLGTPQYANGEFALNGDSNNGLANVTYDDLKMYNYVLSQQDIQLDYNHNSGLVMGSFGTAPDGKTASNSASAVYCVPGDTSTCLPPVGEWNFDEGQGSTVNDTSGNGNTGTWNGSGPTHWTRGEVNDAGNFNGTDDYVNIADNDPFSVNTTNQLTIGAWVNMSTIPSGTVIPISKRASSNYEWDIRIDNGQPKAVLTTSSGSTMIETVSSVNVTAGQWYYLAMTVNLSTPLLTLYVNGIATGSSTSVSGSYTNGTAPISLGRSGDNGNYFPGKIDQVRIYNYARTAAQVAWDYNNGKPLGWWKMDECQGTTLNDASGNGNAGTLTIGASGSQTAVGTCSDGNAADAWNNGTNGKFNSALNFDGIDDYLNVGTLGSLGSNAANGITVSTWFSTASTSIIALMGSRVSSSQDELLFILNQNGSGASVGSIHLKYYDHGGRGVDGTFNAPNLSNGSWHHVVVTLLPGSNTITAYFDGTQRTISYTAQGTPNSFVNFPNAFYIGSADFAGSGGNYFPGKIDDMRIFNYPLTSLQAKLLYNDGAAVRFAPLTGTP